VSEPKASKPEYPDQSQINTSPVFSLCDLQIRKHNDFVPSMADLLSMAVNEISTLKVREVRHRNKKKHDLQSLTFIMSNGQISPPKGSYHAEATQAVSVDREITKVRLKTYKLAFNFYLYSVQLDSIQVMP